MHTRFNLTYFFYCVVRISSDNQRAALEKTKHNMEQLHQARSKAK